MRDGNGFGGRRGEFVAVSRVIQSVSEIARAEPDRVESVEFKLQAATSLLGAMSDPKKAVAVLWDHTLECEKRIRKLLSQNRELVGFVQSLREKPSLGWVLSSPFAVNGNGKLFVYVMPLAREAVPQCYEVALDPENPPERFPPPPFLGFVEPASKVFFEPASRIPPLPVRAEIHTALAARPESRFPGLGEIEVSDEPGERRFTLLAAPALAREVNRKLEEEGRRVSVRAEMGIAVAVHDTKAEEREDWLEFPSLEGPTMKDLIFPKFLHRLWRRDIEMILDGRGVKVLLMGPTGVGKSSAVEYAGREAWRTAVERGKPKKGLALIRLSGPHIGSSYVHQVERNLYAVVHRAKRLAEEGYLVVILADEADALLGEIDGGLEHAHNRSERLAAQELLGQDLKGISIYLTMNPRRNSYLPAPIARRFVRREYPRSTRSQIAAVARHYAARYPSMLKRLGLEAEEFGLLFSANLFSDRRVVAVGHYHSGEELVVRARDLQVASPAKAQSLIEEFAFDIEKGYARTIEDLWAAFDREFRGGEMTVHNVWELTFLRPRANDSLRTLDIVSAGSVPAAGGA